jgi:hypothetical protein
MGFNSAFKGLIMKFVGNVTHSIAPQYLRSYYAQKQFYYRDTNQQQRLMNTFPQLPFSERFSSLSGFSGFPTTNFSTCPIINIYFIKIFLLTTEVEELQ